MTPWGPVLGEPDLASLRGLLDQRLAVVERIGAAIEQASSKRPLLIILDDLQWADQATLLALGSLPGQMFSYPVGWLLALRPQPSSPQLETLITRLTQAGAQTVHLGPLGQDAAAQLAQDLLGAPPDPQLADLVTQAEGNPLYVTELIRSAGQASARTGATLVPFQASVTAHLRTLPDQARDLLKVASVLGREFTVTELAAITGKPASSLLPPLEQALLDEVITDQGSHLAFRHDLIRQAVYDQISAPLRQALHRDAAAALRSTSAPLARVASQYAVGAQPGDEAAIEALTAAAGELFATSLSQAADLALRVLELLGGEDPRRDELTTAALNILGWAGRLDEVTALGEAHLAARAMTPRAEAPIVLAMRRAWAIHTIRPYPAPTPAHLLEDLSVPPGVRASLLALAQSGPMWAGDFRGARRALATAMRLATEDGQDREVATISALVVFCEMMYGDLAGGLGHARRTLTEATRRGWPVAVAVCQTDIGQCLSRAGRAAEADLALQTALKAANRVGFTLLQAECRLRQAENLFHLGRLDDSRAAAQP